MSLFEWIMEDCNPGPRGSIDFEPAPRPVRSPAAIVVCFVIAAALLGGALFGMVSAGWVSDAGSLAIACGILGLYLILGYYVRPRPDTRNLGLLGGLIDHPFRYSDDVNRSLLFFAAILMPARFIAASLVAMGHMVAGSRR